MNAAAENVKSIGVSPNVVVIEGRVRAINVTDNGCYTRIDLPAADQYSGASVCEVFSSKRIGNEGDIVKVTCDISGYTRRVPGKDGRPDWYACTNLLKQVA